MLGVGRQGPLMAPACPVRTAQRTDRSAPASSLGCPPARRPVVRLAPEAIHGFGLGLSIGY